MDGKEIQVGKTYKVKSQRKGTFVARMTSIDDTFATGVIVSGKAAAMLQYNERETGAEVTVRRSFCEFTEVATGAA